MRIVSSRQPRRFHLFFCIAAGAVALLSADASGRALFKCTLPDGKIAYKDTPCDTQADQQQIQMHAGMHKAVNAATSAEPAPKEAPAAAPEPILVPRAAAPTDCSSWAPPEENVDVAQPSNTSVLVSEKPDPMSVANACSAMILECAKKRDDPKTAIDACFKSAPRCTTAQPWKEPKTCCPDLCWQKYSDLRRKCVDPSSASTRAIYDGRCAPGPAEPGESQ
ncbi:MAG TPA: hypothetical protein VLB69_08745 [Rudaea sp.]|nr:hypothetical protein [Rudaea sp.]